MPARSGALGRSLVDVKVKGKGMGGVPWWFADHRADDRRGQVLAHRASVCRPLDGRAVAALWQKL